MPQGHLFVSHATRDLEEARSLVADLEAAGVSCWLAERDIPVGTNYAVEIERAISSARALVLVFSEAACASDHIAREVDLAGDAGIDILPVRIDHSEPSGALRYHLKNRQIVPRDRAVAQIAGLPQAPAGARRPPKPPPSPAKAALPKRHRLRIAVGAMVGALVLLMLGFQLIDRVRNTQFCRKPIQVTRPLVDGMIFPDLTQKRLTAADIAGFTPDDLWVARNEVFARKGRRFQNPCLAAYFEAKPWYKPSYDVRASAPGAEEENVKFLLAQEPKQAEDARLDRVITLGDMLRQIPVIGALF
jgi:hypothetical protein